MSAGGIGYGEQEDAVRALSRHYTGGRLDVDAFDERVRRARAATTAAQLAVLFTDLPEPHPEAIRTDAGDAAGAGSPDAGPGSAGAGAGSAGAGSAGAGAVGAGASGTGAAGTGGAGTGAAGTGATAAVPGTGGSGDPGATARFRVPGPADGAADPAAPTGSVPHPGPGISPTASYPGPAAGPPTTGYPDPSGHPAAGPYPDPSATTAQPHPSAGWGGYGTGYGAGADPWSGPDVPWYAAHGQASAGGGYALGPGYGGPAYPPHPGPAVYGYGGYDPSAPFGREPYSGRPYSDKQKVVAGLLQLFLPFGIGRFYSGYTGLAIAQLLVTVFTFGFGAIWSFIDGIVLLAGSPVDPQGRPMRP